MLLDIVFSLDSVITAVGMANEFWTVKMLALSFLLLIGMTLVADGAGFHVPKGYIYAAISFSVMVEALNQLAARRRFKTSSAEAGAAPKRDRTRMSDGCGALSLSVARPS